MHMLRTQENSQFYRFHDNSQIADQVLTYRQPMIDKKPVEVLQIMYVDSMKYNVVVEFKYLGEQTYERN